MKRRTALMMLPLTLLAWSATAAEAPLRVLATMGVQAALVELEPVLAERAGVQVKIEFAPTLALVERLAKGESADVAILTSEAVQQLAVAGRVHSHVDLVSSLMGIAVAAAAAPPVLTTTEDFVAFLKATPSIAYSARGASGLHMAQLLEKLGLTPVVKPKATIVADGFTATLLREGKVASAVQMYSELQFAGARNIVLLPDALQPHTLSTAAVLTGTRHAEAAAKFVAALTSPEAVAVYERLGMAPLFER